MSQGANFGPIMFMLFVNKLRLALASWMDLTYQTIEIQKYKIGTYNRHNRRTLETKWTFIIKEFIVKSSLKSLFNLHKEF